MNAALQGVVIAAFLAFCRVGSCFMLMPGLSSARVPMLVRLFVAVAATGALLIHLWSTIAPFATRQPAMLLALVISEVLIGSLIGLMARLYVRALQFMASGIASLVGYGAMSGAGIEDMNLGMAKVSVAFMMDPNNSANDNRFALPIRATGIKTLPNGELSIYVTPSAQLKSRNQVTSVEPPKQPKGIALGVYQTFNGVMGGNWIAGFKHDKTGDVKNTRVVAQYGTTIGAATGLDVIGEYRVNDQPANGGNKWLSIGARTDTHLSGPFRFLFEAGHDQVKPDTGNTRNMTKFTAALAASAGKEPGSRPTVRLFLTHAIWNDAARLALSGRTQEVFGDKKAGTSLGIQAETWW